MGARLKIHITVGENASPLTEFRVQRIVLAYQINTIPSATLELAIPGGHRETFLKSKEISACQPGEKITVQIDGKNAFIGIITQSSLSVTRSPSLELTLHHPLIALDSLNRSQVFNQQTDASVLKTLCQAVGDVIFKAKMDAVHEQRVQYQCSDWLMVRYLLDQNGAWLLPQVDTLVVVKPSPAAQADHSLSGNALTSQGDLLLESAECKFSALNQPENLEVTAWDIKNQQSLNVKAKRGELGEGLLGSWKNTSLSKKKWQINYSSSPELATLEAQANGLLMNLDLAHMQGKFIVPGSLSYQPGQTLAVSDFGTSLNGKGMITAVRHIINKAEWKTEIHIGRSGLLPLQVSRQVLDGVHSGVVQAFEKDDKNLDRFRVSLPALGKDNNVLWSRFSVPYASKDRGFICYPEAGDEVVVAFFGDDPDYPVIIGSMYNPKNPAPLPADADNAVKGLIINSDVQLLLNEKDKKILLKVNDNNQLALSEKTAELKGSNITVQGNSIEFKKG